MQENIQGVKNTSSAAEYQLEKIAVGKFEAGLFEEAQVDFTNLTRFANTASNAHAYLGAIKVCLDRPGESIEFLKNSLTINPKNPVALAYRGAANFNLGNDVEEVLKDCEEALIFDSKSVVALTYAACAKVFLGRNEEAINDVDQVIRLCPKKNNIALTYRGGAKYNLGRFEDAIADCAEVLKDKQNAIALCYMGYSNFGLGNIEAAIQNLKDAVTLKPENFQLHSILAKFLREGGRYEEAIQVLDKEILLRTEKEIGIFHKAYVYLYQSKLEVAEKLFNEVSKTRNDSPFVLQGRSILLLLRGQKSESETLQEKAYLLAFQKLTGKDERFGFHLLRAKSYLNNGFLTQAKEATEQLILIEPKSIFAQQLLQEITLKRIAQEPANTKSPNSVIPFKYISWKDIEKTRKIGAGGEAKVYLGNWSDTLVAIKKLKIKHLDSSNLKDFVSEAKAISENQHPNIIRLFGVCVESGRYGMVLEYMSKGALSAVLKYELTHPGSLPWNIRWQIALDIGNGLQFLEGRFVHGDIKSDNILLDENYKAKIGDFGLAKIVKTLTREEMPSRGKGSVPWRAPELLQDPNARRNSSSDIYSYGRVLWEIASCETPFKNENSDSVICQYIISGKTEIIPPDCPPLLVPLINDCLALNPEKRPQPKKITKYLKDNFPTKIKKSWQYHTSIMRLPYYHDTRLEDPDLDDYEKVWSIYLRSPIPWMSISSVKMIINSSWETSFEDQLRTGQKRASNPVFAPNWPGVSDALLRKPVHDLFAGNAAPYKDPDYPNMNIVPLWHGTTPQAKTGILQSGFASLGSSDTGFFGRGYYGTFEAEYAYRVYSKKSSFLFLNWMCCLSAYPVIDGDLPKFQGKTHSENYDARFAPVILRPGDQDEKNYDPCKPNQPHTYQELVVFDKAQILPGYIVEFESHLSTPVRPAIVGNNPHSFFENLHRNQTNLLERSFIETAKYVYFTYLRHEYDLPIYMGRDFRGIDWSYTYNNITIQRHNHGLVHSLIKASCVRLVVDYFIQHNSLSADIANRLVSDIPILEVALLFYSTGRGNDAGSNHSPELRQRFQERSAENFAKYIKRYCPNMHPDKLTYFQQALSQTSYGDGRKVDQLIMTICHFIDTIRFINKVGYNNHCHIIAKHIGLANVQKLRTIVKDCHIAIGDRIMGDDVQRDYDGSKFVVYSQDVDKCREVILQIINSHENTFNMQKLSLAQ